MDNIREVPGTNGKYLIDISTKEGKCISLNYHHKGIKKELSNKPRKDRIFWDIFINRKRISYQAARWIAITFPELVQNEYFEGAVIDHIDTDPMNNHPSNLRWVTRKGNQNNPLTKKHISEAHKGKKIGYYINREDQSKTIIQYTLNGDFIKEYPSLGEAHRQTGVDKANISACCLGKKRCAGTKGGEKYIWVYKVIETMKDCAKKRDFNRGQL